MNAKPSDAGSIAVATKPTTDTPTTTAPRRRRRRVPLGVVAGLLLGGLVALVLGPHSLSPGSRSSGNQQLAADFRSTLASDRGLASIEVARLRDGKVTYAGLAPNGRGPTNAADPVRAGLNHQDHDRVAAG